MLHSRNAIVPTRFMVTISHLTAVIMCFLGMVVASPKNLMTFSQFASPRPFSHSLQESNIISSLEAKYESSQYDEAKSSFVGALSVTVICIAIGVPTRLLTRQLNANSFCALSQIFLVFSAALL